MSTPGNRRARTAIAAGLLLAVVWSLWNAWICDDIFVTYRYCLQMLAGNGPVYNPGEASEGYTHFLWFLLLTLLHALSVPVEWMGRYLGIPFFAATLWLLWRLSQRLFQERGALVLPLAALAWAAHEDARLFASGGLETACFVFFVVLGYFFLVASRHDARILLAAWSLSTAALVRPDGVVFLGVASLFVAWRYDRRQTLQFIGLAVLLLAPLYAFRLSYYGHPFPNPYYAKSGALSWWSQGFRYLSLYLRVYPLLLLALPAGIAALVAVWRGRNTSTEAQHTSAATAALLAAGFAAGHVLSVTRVGGDFMFARFYLPATPFLLLVCEYALRRLPGVRLQATVTLVFVASILAGGALKDVWLSQGRHYYGIVDEPQFYPTARLQQAQEEGRAAADCFEDTGARVLIVAGQLMHAYYAFYPEAIELCGLTDPHVAHAPLQRRERPGHEKFADAQYIYDRAVHFRQRTVRQARALPPYSIMTIPGAREPLYFEIIVYDAALLQRIGERCPGLRFTDFPAWFQRDYQPMLATNATARLVRDYHQFRRYYFDHNTGNEPLLRLLVDELRRRGVSPIPDSPPHPEQFRDFSPYVQDGVLLPN